MSQNSPAKLQRIERHLMRQRGAGVRTVLANFGFAIGTSSAPTSSDATPISKLPPAKRRKTVLQAIETQVLQDESVRSRVLKSVKATKSRRRLPADDAEAIQSAGLDDSFVFGQSKKRKKASKEEDDGVVQFSHEMEVEEVIVPKLGAQAVGARRTTASKPTTKGRPKRQAAATAASKVTEGFVDESIPVNKKRRAPEPEGTRKRSRKKTAPPVTEHLVADTNEGAVDDGAGSEHSRRKRNLDVEIEHVLVNVKQSQPQSSHLVTIGDAAFSTMEPIDHFPKPPKPRLQQSRKRNNEGDGEKVDANLPRPPTVEGEVAPPGQELPAPVARSLERRAPRRNTVQEDGKGEQARLAQRGCKGNIAAEALLAESSHVKKTSQASKRAPLADTDVNTAVSSTSPENALRRQHDVPQPSSPDTKATKSKPHPRKSRHPSTRRSSPSPEDHIRSALPNQVPRPLPDRDQQPNASGPLERRPNNARTHAYNSAMTRLADPTRQRHHRFAVLHSDDQSLIPRSEIHVAEHAVDRVGSVAKTLAPRAAAPKSARTRTGRDERNPVLRGVDGIGNGNEPEIGRSKMESEAGHATAGVAGDGENDVDWLFEAPRGSARPHQRGKCSKPPATSALQQRSQAKIIDMDLDDLISNIASFARSDVAAWSEEGAVVTKVKPKARRGK